MLNRRIRELGSDGWGERQIEQRTSEMIDALINIWPVPAGHVGLLTVESDTLPSTYISVADLLREDMLRVGQVLYGRGAWSEHKAAVLADGQLQIGDTIYETPSGAAKVIRKRAINGWRFWTTAPGGDVSLADVRLEYATRTGVETQADDDADPVEEMR